MARAQRLIPALAVLLAACVAAEAISTPTLGDLLRSRAGSAKVSTASVQEDSYGYDQYGIETKELCLQESEMKTCGWVNNCIDDDAAGPPVGGPPRCTIGQFWTSDFSCCQEANYGYDGPTGLRHSQLWSASANIGTCDWTVLYADPRNLDYTLTGTTTVVPGSTDITSNIAKLGTAWATCYLGADSEACGGPLCDRMVMSMQGTVYTATNAYSHWGASSTITGALCTAVSGPIDLNNPVSATLPPGRAEALNKPAVAVRHEGPVSTAAELQYSGHSHDNYGYDSSTRSVYRGAATIIMGVINGMAGQHKEKWEEGVFEYVPYYAPVGGVPISPPVAIDPSYPWVRDKTYKLTFYRGAKY